MDFGLICNLILGKGLFFFITPFYFNPGVIEGE